MPSYSQSPEILPSARMESGLGERLYRYRHWIVGAIVVFYAASVTPKWQIYPDSSRYLLMAESLARGDGYSIFGQPQGKYPPGFSLYLAAMMKLGLENMLWLNLAMAAMGVASMLFAYLLLRRHTTDRLAFFLTCVLALTYEVYRLSTTQLSDIPFTLIVTAGLWCVCVGLERRGPALESGVLLLLASCWFRVLGIPLALAAAVALLVEPRQVSRGRVALNAACLVLGVALTSLWLYNRDRQVQATAFPPLSYSNTVSKVQSGGVFDRLSRPLAHFYQSGASLSRLFTTQRIPNAAALLGLWLPVGIGAIYSARHGQFLLLLLTTLGYLGAIFLTEVPVARYYLPVAPALFLCFAVGLRQISAAFHRIVRAGRPLPIAAGALVVLVTCNLPKDLRHIYDQHTTDFQTSSSRYDLARTAAFLEGEARRGNDVRFVMDSGATSVAFLSETYCLPIGKTVAKRLSQPEDIYETLLQNNINYLVLWKRPEHRRPFFDAIDRCIDSWAEYRLVYDVGNIAVYRAVPAAPRTTELDGPGAPRKHGAQGA